MSIEGGRRRVFLVLPHVCVYVWVLNYSQRGGGGSGTVSCVQRLLSHVNSCIWEFFFGGALSIMLCVWGGGERMKLEVITDIENM